MKSFRSFLRGFKCVPLIFLFSGCATTTPELGRTTRFHEGDSAGLIVHFRQWDNMQVLRPDSREGGFLPILTRGDLVTKLRSERVSHDLAVVVVGSLCLASQEGTLVGEWQQFFSQQGFRRFVILRLGGKPEAVDGLPVVYDSQHLSAGSQPASTGLASRDPG